MSWCVDVETMASRSMATAFESGSVNIDEVVVASVDILWSGNDGEATVALQASNDEVNWCNIDTACTITGAAGHQLIDLTQMQRFSYRVLRAKYDPGTSTTGTISIKIRKKSNRSA